MKFNFSATREEAEDKYNLGKGQYFKVKDGSNKIRLVSICLPHSSEYNGQMTFKWLCQVIDRKDNKIKPYFMPDKIYKAILNLQLDPEYVFEEVPMPYDLNIQAVNAGKKEVVYTVIPARTSIPLTDAELEMIKETPTVQEVQAKVRENDIKTQNTPAQIVEDARLGQVNSEDIDF